MQWKESASQAIRVAGQIKEAFVSDTYILIHMDAFTPHKVIRINQKKELMYLIYNRTESGMVKLTPV